MENLERLSKIMAFRGLCSRREADIFIEKGFVAVNGNVVSVLGSKVPIDSEIKLSEEAIILQDSSITILLNKPIGFVSGQPEDNYKPAISLIKKNNRWNRFVLCSNNTDQRRVPPNSTHSSLPWVWLSTQLPMA